MTTKGAPSPWRDPVALLAAPAVLYLLVVYAFPLLWLFMKSLTGPGGLTIQPYVAFLSDPFNWRVVGNTLRVAAWVTVVCFVIGYPAAFALARAGAVLQIVMLVSIILPLSVGVVVKAFAWQIVLRRDGIVSQTLVGLGLWDEPQRLLFTETGLVIGAANVFLPFMILPIYSVVKLIDPRLSEAGATLGATPLYRFAHVTLPLTLPGIVSGVAFVFSMSGLDVRHPLAADRRPLPDPVDADRPLLPADAQRAARLDHRRHPAGARRIHRRGLDLAGAPDRRQHRMTAIERVSQYVVWFIAAFTVVFLLTPLVVTIAGLVRLVDGLYAAAARLVAALVRASWPASRGLCAGSPRLAADRGRLDGDRAWSSARCAPSRLRARPLSRSRGDRPPSSSRR